MYGVIIKDKKLILICKATTSLKVWKNIFVLFYLHTSSPTEFAQQPTCTKYHGCSDLKSNTHILCLLTIYIAFV